MTSQSYWATLILDDEIAESTTMMTGHDNRLDAVQSYVMMIVEDYGGGVTSGAVRLWDLDGSREDATFFDFTATLTRYEGEDAREHDFECLLELAERE